ncbi:homeobox protein engrailed-1 [Cyclospora cayetanensis]|uniref:Homeobox protein engrailed-1 n=1 Tax=Cyclospora cayetanensis TaxID=88456 RepID=A0A6P6RSY4_9EIME|nr:homeobox protein engrailed-1 [Cyclospora cayetanensis]
MLPLSLTSELLSDNPPLDPLFPVGGPSCEDAADEERAEWQQEGAPPLKKMATCQSASAQAEYQKPQEGKGATRTTPHSPSDLPPLLPLPSGPLLHPYALAQQQQQQQQQPQAPQHPGKSKGDTSLPPLLERPRALPVHPTALSGSAETGGPPQAPPSPRSRGRPLPPSIAAQVASKKPSLMGPAPKHFMGPPRPPPPAPPSAPPPPPVMPRAGAPSAPAPPGSLPPLLPTPGGPRMGAPPPPPPPPPEQPAAPKTAPTPAPASAAAAAATAPAATRQQHMADCSERSLHRSDDADALLSPPAAAAATAAAATVVCCVACPAADAGAAAAADSAAAAAASAAAAARHGCGSSSAGGVEWGVHRPQEEFVASAGAAGSAVLGKEEALPSSCQAQQAHEEHPEEDEERPQQQPSQDRLPRSQKKLLSRESYRQKKRQKRPEERRERRRKKKAELFEGLHTSEEKTAAMKAHKDQLQEQRKAHLAHLEECMREGIRVCFNCSFDENMQDKVQIHLASFAEGSRCRVACEQLFSGASWLVHRHEEPYWQCFNPKEIVVLSPDAEEELLDVDSSKTFVIGGLVDRTVTKAVEHGLTCRRLPFKVCADCNPERWALLNRPLSGG